MLLREKVEARIALLKNEKRELENINTFKSYLAKRSHCKKIEAIDQSLGELEKFKQFQVNQRVNDSIHSGTVIQLDVTNGGLPQVWVAWDDYFTVPELPRRLQICSLSLIYRMELKPEVECKAKPLPVVTVRTSDIPTSPPMPTWETCQNLPLISLLIHHQSGTRAENGKTQPIEEPEEPCLDISVRAASRKDHITQISETIMSNKENLKSLLGDTNISPSNGYSDFSPSNINPSTESLLGDINISPSNNGDEISSQTNPSKTGISPSNKTPSKTRRRKGEGNGSIYCRTINKNGNDYLQAYYHWKENGQKRSKYIPKSLLEVICEAEAQKRPVKEILELLALAYSPSKESLLGDININPSKADISPSNISPSKIRRQKGNGSGTIHWKPCIRQLSSGLLKEYLQPWYHYELWNDGDRLKKGTAYIPNKLLSRVQELDKQKAPVSEILKLLGVKK